MKMVLSSRKLFILIDFMKFNQKNFSDLTKNTISEHFFSNENKKRIIERLQRTSSTGGAGFRILKPKDEEMKKLRQAAVLVPLIDVNGIASILFTVRSNYLSMHRGEVSFPGGKADDVDGGEAERTALREAHEEIGIDPKNVEVWGHLAPILSRDGDTVITPVIGFIRNGYDSLSFTQRQQGSMDEVWTIFTRDFESLCNREYLSFTQFRAGYSLPIFHGGGFRIWGLTAIILHNALKILVPDLYRPIIRYTKPVV